MGPSAHAQTLGALPRDLMKVHTYALHSSSSIYPPPGHAHLHVDLRVEQSEKQPSSIRRLGGA